MDGLVATAEAAAGMELDILVSNAGVTRDGLLLRMKDDDWGEVMTVNLESYFRLARSALRGMMRRRRGRIIGITSVVGVMGNAGQTNYAASKAGMIGFTKALAQEIASRDITANCVAPGFIESPMTDAFTDQQKRRSWQRPAGPPRRRRRRGGGLRLPGQRRGRVRHRPDPARERRHGDDLRGGISGLCPAGSHPIECGLRTLARMAQPTADFAKPVAANAASGARRGLSAAAGWSSGCTSKSKRRGMERCPTLRARA